MTDDLDPLHVAAHVLSMTALIGVLTKILPTLAALVTLIWYVLCIFEKPMVQRWIARLRGKHAKHP